MSAKYLGIGLLSIGGLIVGATGGYLALKRDVPPPAEIAAAPLPAPVAAPVPDPVTKPAETLAAPIAVAATRPQPVTQPQSRTMVNASGKPITINAPVQRQTSELPASAPTPTPSPTVTPVAVSEPPVATPTPAVTEVPRYVPDTPTAAAVSPEPQRIEFEELTVAKHSVIGIRLDAPISTRTARVEDRVSATVSRDVTVAGRTAIAAGVRLEGTVVLVERGGRFRNRPRLGLQFDRMILADGTRVNLKTDTIYREGDSPTADATAKVGTGAVAGAILGAMIGGKKGAVIGSAAGAAGGVATVMRGDEGEASLPGGAPLTVRLTEDVAVRINR